MKIVKGPLANACFMEATQRNSSFSAGSMVIFELSNMGWGSPWWGFKVPQAIVDRFLERDSMTQTYGYPPLSYIANSMPGPSYLSEPSSEERERLHQRACTCISTK